MRKLLCLLILVGAFFAIAPVATHADTLDQYNAKSCEPGEKEAIAQYTTAQPFGRKTFDESLRYADDERYYKLSEYQHSKGGEVKYCQIKVNETLNVISVIAVMISAITGLIYTRSQDAA